MERYIMEGYKLPENIPPEKLDPPAEEASVVDFTNEAFRNDPMRQQVEEAVNAYQRGETPALNIDIVGGGGSEKSFDEMEAERKAKEIECARQTVEEAYRKYNSGETDSVEITLEQDPEERQIEKEVEEMYPTPTLMEERARDDFFQEQWRENERSLEEHKYDEIFEKLDPEQFGDSYSRERLHNLFDRLQKNTESVGFEAFVADLEEKVQNLDPITLRRLMDNPELVHSSDDLEGVR